MNNKPVCNMMINGVVAAMLSLLGAVAVVSPTGNCQETIADANDADRDTTKTLKAGMAKTVITPPVGTQLSGYGGRTDPSTEVLDDLYAKALVFDDGNERISPCGV